MKIRHLVPIIAGITVLSSCAAPEVATAKPSEEVVTALRGYYAAKYPAYAELRDLKPVHPAERARKATELFAKTPVSEIINSFPGRPIVSFSERTETPGGKASFTRVDVYGKDDGSSRIVVETKPAKGKHAQAFAEAEPITAGEIRKLLE